MDKIREWFDCWLELDNSDWGLFINKMQEVKFAKGSVILEAGKIERHTYFIAKGMLRYFYLRPKDDLTFDFGYPNEFASGYDSFITQTPANYNIEAIADSVLWRISYTDLQKIYETTAKGHAMGRVISESLYLKRVKRERLFITENAEKRYNRLLRDHPTLPDQVLLRFIASYLGITPPELSRIRKRVAIE